MDSLESMKLKFTSGNSIPVTRALITLKEYVELCEIVAYAEKDIGVRVFGEPCVITNINID